MDFPTLYANTIQAAFIKIVIDKGVRNTIDLHKACDTLKAESLAQYDTILAECKEALDANMGETMYKAVLNAGCVMVAISGYKAGMGE